MKRIQLSGDNYIIKFHKADEMPLKRYAKFQKYLLYKTGIGSNIESVGEHFNNWFAFNAHEKHEEAKKEAENLYYNFFAILQEIDYEDLAFACLVYSINGELVEDLSEQSLFDLIKKLSDCGMTKELVSLEVDDTRHSVISDLKIYFPKFFPESDDLTFYQKAKQRMMLTAEKILKQIEQETTEDDEEIIRLLDALSLYFVELRSPKNFNSDEIDNAAIKLDAQYEQLCSMIEANGGIKAKDFTMIEFYSRLEFIRKSNKPAK